MPKTHEATTKRTVSKSEGSICWTFNDPSGKPFMQVRRYTTELCYQLWEWRQTNKRTGEVVWGWKPIDCYPCTLEVAVLKVMNYMVERCGGATDDVKKMAVTIRKIEKEILEGVSKVGETVEEC